MKKLINLFLGLMCFSLICTGCRSGAQLEEVNSSLKEIHKAIFVIIGKPREMSRDNKEVFSQYRDNKGNTIAQPDKVRERVHTFVYILGDRRPFSIQVEVIHEMKNEIGQYTVVKKDEKAANLLSDKIKAELAKGRDGQSLIDDFRPF
ncbi:MAG TPA: hypothetical protein PLJ21_02830 [Pseudobdellovibrionaceae bacterium]|nr:hypothetical protein [Pseudobdellovibrionaceae bacterium]